VSSEVEVYRNGELITAELVLAGQPEEVLRQAQNAAFQLKKVIDGKKNPVKFRDEIYLEFEDWQTVGRFYGVTAKIASVEFVEFGGVKGFHARAIAIRSDGEIVASAAEAFCLSDEDNWKAKSLAQMASMAQTRACAKSLRNVLSWVVVLAGYMPTPAEELGESKAAQRKRPQRSKETPAGESPASSPPPGHTAETDGGGPGPSSPTSGEPPTAYRIDAVEVVKSGKTNGKDWTIYRIKAGGLGWTTVDGDIVKAAKLAQEQGRRVLLLGQKNQYGDFDIEELRITEIHA
jgi:hypothetical protein